MEKKKREKISILPQYTSAALGMLAMLLGEAVFLFFVLALDVLPFKYVALLLVMLFAMDIGIWLLLRNRRKGTVKRIVGLILAFVVMNALLFGDFYVYSTYDTLQKISAKKAMWEKYVVVVLKDGQYQTVDDIEGETVNIISMQSKQQNEAKERLVTKAGVNYNEEADCISVGKHLIDDDGNKHDEILLINNNNYQLLKENIDGFADNTKRIYKIIVKRRADDNAKHIDVTEESFNVLISGCDTWGPINETGLTDVNMIMTINPKTKKVLLTSIPRDSYVVLHSYGQYDKLTHSGIYGVDETRATLEDFLGIDINYYVRVNFVMLVRLVHAVGGIDVYSDYAFKSAIHDLYYEKGWNHLYGKKALYFARERKAFSDGDMQRNKNQQKVLEAIFKKITNSKVLLTRYPSILEAVEEYMQTDMTDKELKKLARMQIKDMAKWEFENYSITGSTGGAGTYSMGMDRSLSVVFCNQDDVQEAKKLIHDIMYPVKNSQTKETKENETKSTDGSGGNEDSNSEE